MQNTNIVTILEKNAGRYPTKNAYIYFDEKKEERAITYCVLLEKIKKLAGYFQYMEAEGERVLIIIPSGIDYVIAFFGCIFANTIAVPAYCAGTSHHKRRLQEIIDNSKAKYVLVNQGISEKKLELFLEKDLVFVNINDILEDEKEFNWIKGNYESDTTAYIQYTSGTTNFTKGSIISHSNIIANERMTEIALNAHNNEVFVCWLPLYHDMGLVGNIILSAYLGATCVIMNSLSFTSSPKFWLFCISRYRATIITAPNFAYQLCIDRIADEDLHHCDLSSLNVVINGAEPIRLDTLEGFKKKFGAYGLKEGVMNPSYGLAENTLITTTHRRGENYRCLLLEYSWLNKNKLVLSEKGLKLVSSGKILDMEVIKILDTKTLDPVDEGDIGEIWLNSNSIAKGYWGLEKMTKEYFGLKIDGYSMSFFKTGDIGFIKDEYLYVLDRLSDLIVIKNKKYLAQDIEYILQNKVPELVKDSLAAFIIEQGEKLVIVSEISKSLRKMPNNKNRDAELKKESRRDEITQMIYDTIQKIYKVKSYDIVLIREKSIPKTSSGKVQRQLCKKMYLENKLIQ